MASSDNKMEFEFILYEVEPTYSPTLEFVVPTHKHKKRSNLTLDFPTFANTPNLELIDYSSSGSTPSTNTSNSTSTNTSNPSSTLISRVNSKDDGTNIYRTSAPMSPNTSSDRGRATSLGSSSRSRTKSPSSPINETLVADMKMVSSIISFEWFE